MRLPPAPTSRIQECLLTESSTDWRGIHRMPHVPHAITLDSELDAGDLTATLNSGRHPVADVSRGMLRSSYTPSDLPAAVVTRSPRFRTLAARWRESPAVVRDGMLILTIDRTGSVDGLPLGQ